MAITAIIAIVDVVSTMMTMRQITGEGKTKTTAIWNAWQCARSIIRAKRKIKSSVRECVSHSTGDGIDAAAIKSQYQQPQ